MCNNSLPRNIYSWNESFFNPVLDHEDARMSEHDYCIEQLKLTHDEGEKEEHMGLGGIR